MKAIVNVHEERGIQNDENGIMNSGRIVYGSALFIEVSSQAMNQHGKAGCTNNLLPMSGQFLKDSPRVNLSRSGTNPACNMRLDSLDQHTNHAPTFTDQSEFILYQSRVRAEIKDATDWLDKFVIGYMEGKDELEAENLYLDLLMAESTGEIEPSVAEQILNGTTHASAHFEANIKTLLEVFTTAPGQLDETDDLYQLAEPWESMHLENLAMIQQLSESSETALKALEDAYKAGISDKLHVSQGGDYHGELSVWKEELWQDNKEEFISDVKNSGMTPEQITEKWKLG